MSDKRKFLKNVPFTEDYPPDIEVMDYVNEMDNFGSDVKELIVDFFRTTYNPKEVLRLMQLERRIESNQELSKVQTRRIKIEINELKTSLGLIPKKKEKSESEKKIERIEELKRRLNTDIGYNQKWRIRKELEVLESE